MVLSGVIDRLAPLQAWLFPQRVYLQIEDQWLTAMAIEGSSLRWLERVPLPDGLCLNGEPLLPDALGDLLGDWLVERGYPGARIKLVLPRAATCWRMIAWPQGRWPEQPELAVREQEQQLALPWSLEGQIEGADLWLQPLSTPPPRSLMQAARRQVLEGWIEVCALAGVALHGMEASWLCLARAAAAVLPPAARGSCALLLQLGEAQSWLLAFTAQQPLGEWPLPGRDQPEALSAALARWKRFWQNQPDGLPVQQLLVAGAAASSLDPLAEALGCDATWLDPLAAGWLADGRSAERADNGAAADLAVLWGLALTEQLR